MHDDAREFDYGHFMFKSIWTCLLRLLALSMNLGQKDTRFVVCVASGFTHGSGIITNPPNKYIYIYSCSSIAQYVAIRTGSLKPLKCSFLVLESRVGLLWVWTWSLVKCRSNNNNNKRNNKQMITTALT